MTNLYDHYSLKELDLLNQLGREPFDNLTHLAAQILGVPVSLVSIIDPAQDRQYFKSIFGTLNAPYHEQRQTPLSHSFCQYVANYDRPLIVTDATNDPRVEGNGAIKDLGVVAYLGVPIHNPQNQAIGALCAISDMPRSWTEDDKTTLELLAKCVNDAIRLNASQRSFKAERESRQLKELVIRELKHRLNNLFSSIQSMISLSRKNYDDVVIFAQDLSRRIFALSHANTASLKGNRTDTFQLRDLIQEIFAQYTQANYDLKLDIEDHKIAQKFATPFGLILNELATNATKYGAWKHGGTIVLKSQVQTTEGAFATLHFSWQEVAQNTHITGAPEMTGFGSRLIELSLNQMQATHQAKWHPSGLHFSFQVLLEPTQKASLPDTIAA